jgi:hypothetical protein
VNRGWTLRDGWLRQPPQGEVAAKRPRYRAMFSPDLRQPPPLTKKKRAARNAEDFPVLTASCRKGKETREISPRAPVCPGVPRAVVFGLITQVGLARLAHKNTDLG